MAKVHYSSLAAKDLCDNAEYIARDKPDAAYRWVEAIRTNVRTSRDQFRNG